MDVHMIDLDSGLVILEDQIKEGPQKAELIAFIIGQEERILQLQKERMDAVSRMLGESRHG